MIDKNNENEMWMLSERAKELECMYAVDEVLNNKHLALPIIMHEIVKIIPTGFAYPTVCKVRIVLNGNTYESDDFSQSAVLANIPVKIDDNIIGSIEVGYIQPFLHQAECVILKNEEKLLAAISMRISLLTLTNQRELSILFDMLQHIDPDMLLRVCEKLRVYLLNTVGEHIRTFFDENDSEDKLTYGEVNTPIKNFNIGTSVELSRKLIAAAVMFLPSIKVSELINGWVTDERAFSIVYSIDSKETNVEQILESVRRYTRTVGEHSKNVLTERWLVSELCHRFLTTDEKLINLILDNLQISDFECMMERIIGSGKSQGNIGGKGAGLFIASQILSRAAKEESLLADIKVPKTWYLATDQIVDFLHYNNFEEMRAYKYNSAFHLRLTYDNVVKKIKNGKLPPYTIRVLRVLLDDLEGVPLIVRSSSLLEDRMTSAFSGKYKSLFLANCGTKEKRLEELIDAILEVYSSMYNPDSICYRSERGLLNCTEQMGVLIQEVVGTKIGSYFMPVFAGVAFSENQLRWSPRILKEDGLVRMVMGLGTRAVDRVNNDYPTLFSPAKPKLRVNQTPEEIMHYSPKYIDLINLEKQEFETVSVPEFLKEYGNKVPMLHKITSAYVEADMMMQQRSAFEINPKKDKLSVTFDGVLYDTDIPEKLKRMLMVLSEKMQTPVDIEFAFDGKNIYLLQCRAQGRGIQKSPAPIPAHLPHHDILFTANRFITNGRLQNITHIVYIDPYGYNNLSAYEDLYAVGKAVGMLSNLLPKRQYILMGPGRWGSRGDITLGVRVTYSDISNTAALIEIAKEKHNYVPELSFGTHFFQDLVEADIAYIPLYPDQPKNIFKEGFFLSSDNLLEEILPQFSHISHVLKVIDVPANCLNKTLSIHLNADLEQAVAFLTSEKRKGEKEDITPYNVGTKEHIEIWNTSERESHQRWRQYMAEQIAAEIDMELMGVKRIYVFGSTNTGQTHMRSDIDLLVHFCGDENQKAMLQMWFQGWSKALAKVNYLRTGYSADGLLDVHIITDKDIENHDSFASKIDSITDPATLLRER